jgi:hypothetical protein
MGEAAGTPAAYIGLSSAVTAPDAVDSELHATEYTDFGLERVNAAASYAHVDGETHYHLSNEFTCDTDAKTVASAGLFFGAGASALFAGVAITSVTLQTDDTLTVNWTVTISQS